MRGKDIPVRSGVYVMQIGEKYYIGQTRNFYQRYMGHCSANGQISEIDVIYIEMIEDEMERKYRESVLILDFLACGLPILNKRIYEPESFKIRRE